MKPHIFIFLACTTSIGALHASTNKVMKSFSADGQLLSQIPVGSGPIGFGKDCKQSQCFYVGKESDNFNFTNEKNLQQQRRHDPSAKYSMDDGDGSPPSIGFGYTWSLDD
ncbi:hypothetical protein ACE38U_14630 [Cedecea sp. S5-13]|jgi:hypothetical protein|uniref:hypothetical protein n=1 Tax=Cedecea TaxID=158483 RepID=UPI00118683E6|nr:hypothetical protein [Cedecea neteri]